MPLQKVDDVIAAMAERDATAEKGPIEIYRECTTKLLKKLGYDRTDVSG
jgi:hypothetical protein